MAASHVAYSDLEEPEDDTELDRSLSVRTRLKRVKDDDLTFESNEKLFIHCCTIFILSFRCLSSKMGTIYEEEFTKFMEIMANVCSIPFFDDRLRDRLLSASRYRAESFSYHLHISIISSEGIHLIASRRTEDQVFLVAEYSTIKGKHHSIRMQLFQNEANGPWLPSYNYVTKKVDTLMIHLSNSIVDNDRSINLNLVIIKSKAVSCLCPWKCSCCLNRQSTLIISLTPSQIQWNGLTKYFPVSDSPAIRLKMKLKWALKPKLSRGGYNLFRKRWKFHDQLLARFFHWRWRKRSALQSIVASCLGTTDRAAIVSISLISDDSSSTAFFWDSQNAPYNADAISNLLKTTIPNQFCICSEWCSIYAFYFSNPIVRFVLGQNQHLFLIPDEYIIPFHFKSICAFINSKNFACSSMLSSILGAVYFYIKSQLQARAGNNEEAFWRNKGARILEEGYLSLRDWLSRPESFRLSKYPFDDYPDSFKYFANSLVWLSTNLKNVTDNKLASILRVKFQDIFVQWIATVLDNPTNAISSHVIHLTMGSLGSSKKARSPSVVASTSADLPVHSGTSLLGFHISSEDDENTSRIRNLPLVTDVMINERESDELQNPSPHPSPKLNKTPSLVRSSSLFLTGEHQKSDRKVSKASNESLKSPTKVQSSLSQRNVGSGEVVILCSKHFSLLHKIYNLIIEIEPGIPFNYYDKQLYKTEAKMIWILDYALRKKSNLNSYTITVDHKSQDDRTLLALVRRYYTIIVYSFSFDIQSFMLDHLAFTYYKEFDFNIDVRRVKFFCSNHWIEHVNENNFFTSTELSKQGIQKWITSMTNYWGVPRHHKANCESVVLLESLAYEIFCLLHWIKLNGSNSNSKTVLRKQMRFIENLNATCKSQYENTLKDLAGNIFPLILKGGPLNEKQIKLTTKTVKAFAYNIKCLVALICQRVIKTVFPMDPKIRCFLLFSPIWLHFFSSKDVFKSSLDDTRRRMARIEGDPGKAINRILTSTNRQITILYGSIYVALFNRWFDEFAFLKRQTLIRDADSTRPSYMPRLNSPYAEFKHMLHLHVVLGYSLIQRFSSSFYAPYGHFSEKLDSMLKDDDPNSKSIIELIVKIREEQIKYDSKSLSPACSSHVEFLKKSYPVAVEYCSKWNFNSDRIALVSQTAKSSKNRKKSK